MKRVNLSQGAEREIGNAALGATQARSSYLPAEGNWTLCVAGASEAAYYVYNEWGWESS